MQGISNFQDFASVELSSAMALEESIVTFYKCFKVCPSWEETLDL